MPGSEICFMTATEGLAVGVQIVVHHGDAFGVLQLSHAFESTNGFWRRRTPIVRPTGP